MSDDRLLTDAELDHMRVLWELEEGSVRAVLEALPVQILERKGFAVAHKVGRRRVYRPLVPRSAYQARALDRVLADVFEGDAGALVRQLSQTESLDAEAVAELRALVAGLED